MSGADAGVASLSVIVSIVGRQDDLAELKRDTDRALSDLGVPYELLYLLNSSDPQLIDSVRGLQEADPKHVRVLQFATSVGAAPMLEAGAEHARGDVIVTLPPRFESRPDAIATLYEAVAEDADLAVASRHAGRRDRAGRLQSEAFNRIVSRVAGTRFSDIAGATRAMRREVLQEIPLYGDFHRYLPLLANRAGFRVREVEVAPHERASTAGVHSASTYLWRAFDVLSILFISRFTRHPLRLFGALGTVFAGTGSLLMLVLGAQRLLGTPLADRPALVLATLLVGLGVQAFAIGLLGELILFFHAGSLRDYRITAIYESDPPALPPREADEPVRTA